MEEIKKVYYVIWDNMVQRCKSHINYTDIVVCEEWLNFSNFEPKNNIFLDRKKLFKGDFSELNSLLADFGDNTVAAAFAVKTKTEDDGDKKSV